jgi:hypothetical protein
MREQDKNNYSNDRMHRDRNTVFGIFCQASVRDFVSGALNRDSSAAGRSGV